MKPEETMPAASSDPALELEPVNMYILFARLFADIAREVEKSCGEKGIQAVREGVRIFGEKRGQDIARRARLMGHQCDAEHYLSCYDMGRTDFFASDDDIQKETVEQIFTKCIFAQTWEKDGDQKYGLHYCEVIDPAIARGYNPCFHCLHDKHFFKDDQCHFLFEMKPEAELRDSL